MNTASRKRRPRKIILLIAALALCVAAGASLFYFHNPSQALETYLQEQLHPLVFFGLMAILPIIGAPISIFLVMVGIKFGLGPGIAVTALLMAFHMSVSYYLANSFLYKWLAALLRLFDITLPIFVGRLNRRTAVIFMLIPGVPYVVKNTVLALSKIGFFAYMVINWTAQFGMGIPLIIAGRAVVDMNLSVMAAAAALLLVIYLIQHLIKRRHSASGDG